jgi:AraC family transcriptional regulator, transcriptional activator of pobA
VMVSNNVCLPCGSCYFWLSLFLCAKLLLLGSKLYHSNNLGQHCKKYDFFKTKYGDELLIDLIRLESLEKYMVEDCAHSLTYYDITLLTGGAGTFYIDQYQYSIQPGMVLLSSPGQMRKWDFEELPTGYVLIFEEAFLNCFFNDAHFIGDLKYFNTCSSPPQLALSASDAEYLIRLMQDIEQEVGTFSINDQHILRAMLYQVLVWLNRRYSVAYPSAGTEDYNRYIRQFINLVDRDFAIRHEVSYYAGELHITDGHFNDLCKIHLGTSAKNYIQNRLITQAKRLLWYSDLQVAEIALQLNFDDPSYFVRKFKQHTGSTPLMFRQGKNP